MGCKRLKLFFLFVVFTALIMELKAYKFYIGGQQGWVVTPSENYNQWAGRMRFQVNDTIFFKYKNGTDSVLLVNQGEYDKCNTQNPITKLDGGDSIYKFERSGPFFFISGTKDNCNKGQKVHIVVMAVRNKSPPVAPAPSAQAPATSPVSPAPFDQVPEKSPETGDASPAGEPPGQNASGPGSSLTPPSSLSPPPPTVASPPPSAGDVVTPSIILLSAFTFVATLIA